MRMSPLKQVIAAAALVVAPLAHAAELTGAGASFPAPVYAKWADAYHKATGNRVNYQSIGSSGGIRQIQAKTVDFGASDAPLKPEDLVLGAVKQDVLRHGKSPGVGILLQRSCREK